MNWEVASFSDAGPRSSNEDSILVEGAGDNIWIGVADGLGGHFGGAVASSYAVRKLLSLYEGDPAKRILNAFLSIHTDLRAQQEQDPSLRNMATTFTAVSLRGAAVTGAHCGDTRCVVARARGIQKLTVEHTEARRLLEAGKLTKRQWIDYPRRNILDSALGALDEPRVDEFEFDAQINDWIIITSDGVHELIKLREMRQLLDACDTPTDLVNSAVARVKELGAVDNYSIICARANP